MVEVHREALERGRHELGRAEGAGPRADQPVGLDVAAREDFQRREKFLTEVIAAAADAGERRGRAQHCAVAALGAVVRFHAPDGGDNVPIDAVGALHRREHRSILRQQLAPARDALIAHQEIEIVPGRFVELRLGVEQIHDAQVGREPCRQLLERLAADAAPLGQRLHGGDAIAEIGGGGADGVSRHQRMARGARLPAPFARRTALSLSLCRNRRLRGGLKYPAQPVVFRQSLSARLRCLLGNCCSRKAQADQTDCNDAEDLRKERHGESRRPTGALSLVCTGRRYVTGHLRCRPGEAARCLTSDPLWFCVYIGVRCIPAGNVPLLT